MNGMQWIGKQFDKNGKILYELNNKKDGLNNKEYDDYYSELIFEGQYLNGKRFKGKEYYHGKLLFDGEYLNGKW